MTDLAALAAAALAVVALGFAVWYHLPRRPQLDGERWFKLWFATALRGRAERAGATAETWAAEVVRFVPYHPAGRWPEQKVMRPETLPPSPLLEGEAALCAALAAIPTREERWAYLYDREERGLVARLSDPQELGASYSPDQAIGPGLSWDLAAKGGEALSEQIRGSTRATWILVPGSEPGPDLLGAIGRVMGGRAIVLPDDAPCPDPGGLRSAILVRRSDGLHADRVLRLLAFVAGYAPSYADRVVFVGQGDGIFVILDALAASAPLRDQVEAVVSLGSPIQGVEGAGPVRGWDACTAWNQTFFRHTALDLEAAREVPYLSLAWLDRSADPPGALGIPLERARFPAPADPDAPRRSIRVVDLGVLPLDPELPLDSVAEALVGVTLGLARRP